MDHDEQLTNLLGEPIRKNNFRTKDSIVQFLKSKRNDDRGIVFYPSSGSRLATWLRMNSDGFVFTDSGGRPYRLVFRRVEGDISPREEREYSAQTTVSRMHWSEGENGWCGCIWTIMKL